MEDKSHEYTGPTSQAPTVLNTEVKMQGRDAGCASCIRADKFGDAQSVSTKYVTNDGVQHYHVYIANYGVKHEGDGA